MLIEPDDNDPLFYEIIKNRSVGGGTTVGILVYCNSVDSVCSHNILTGCLITDCIRYTSWSVNNYDTLKHIYDTCIHIDDTPYRTIVLINMCATIDLYELLDINNHNDIDEIPYVFFIVDYHRPIHLSNIHNEIIDSESVALINVVVREEREQWNIDHDNYPALTYTGYNDDNDNDNDSLTVQQRNIRRRKTETEAEYNDRVDKYYNGTTYSLPTSYVMYEISLAQGKQDNDLLWCCIVGITDLYINNMSDDFVYATLRNNINGHLTNSHNNDNNESINSINNSNNNISYIINGNIVPSDELICPLLRHWTIYESLYHTDKLYSHFKLYGNRGREYLKEIFAALELSLQDSQYLYNTLKKLYKIEVDNTLSNVLKKKYNVDNLTYNSYIRQYSNGFVMSACDMVYCIQGLLTCNDSNVYQQYNITYLHDAPYISQYNLACSALVDRQGHSLLKQGINLAIANIKSIIRECDHVIGSKLIQKMSDNDIYYVTIDNIINEQEYLLHPIHIRKLTELLRMIKNNSHNQSFICSILNKQHEYIDYIYDNDTQQQLTRITTQATYTVLSIPAKGHKSYFKLLYDKAIHDMSQKDDDGNILVEPEGIYTSVDPSVIYIQQPIYKDFFIHLDSSFIQVDNQQNNNNITNNNTDNQDNYDDDDGNS